MTLMEQIAKAKKAEDDLRAAQKFALEKVSERKSALIKKLEIMCPRCDRKNELGRMFFRNFRSTNEEIVYSYFEQSRVVCSLCGGETEIHKLTPEDRRVINEYKEHMLHGADIIDTSGDDY